MTEHDRQKRKWDKLASKWVLTGPPASPSPQDVGNFRTLLREGLQSANAGKVMILGCTPHLRDMFSEHPELKRFDVVCADFSTEMYTRTSEAVKYHNPREEFVLTDWLTMNLGRQSFDAVLGDKVIDNVVPSDWEKFFGKIHYHLVPKGHFIVHLAPQNMTLKHVTFSNLLDKWTNYYRHHQLLLYQVVSALWEELLGASAFTNGIRHYTQKIERFTEDLERIRANIDSLDQIKREVFNEFIYVFWDSREDEWSSYDYDQILDVMSRFFTHDKTVHSGDYNAAGVQPIVRMKAK